MGQEQGPSIRANSISAENVVAGSQISGGADRQTLLELARTIANGQIDSDRISAVNLVAGLQYVSVDGGGGIDQLRKEVSRLATSVRELRNEPDGDVTLADASVALDDAAAELDAAEPSGTRVKRKLREVSEVITEVADSAEATSKFAENVTKLAPMAAAIWQAASTIFGG